MIGGGKKKKEERDLIVNLDSFVLSVFSGDISHSRKIGELGIFRSVEAEPRGVTGAHGRFRSPIDRRRRFEESKIHEQRGNRGVGASDKDNTLRVHGGGRVRDLDTGSNSAYLGKNDFKHARHETGRVGS